MRTTLATFRSGLPRGRTGMVVSSCGPMAIAGQQQSDSSSFPARIVCRSTTAKRPGYGFSLFEVVLAIALGATVMMLVGLAIDMCLSEFDSGRAKVEHSQLARSIFDRLEDDLQHVLRYQPQDISAASQLAEALAESGDDASFNVDAVDAPAGSSQASGFVGAGTSSSSSGSSGGSGGGGAADTPGENGDETQELPPGLYGTSAELMLDRIQLPSMEQLGAAASASTDPPSVLSDVKMVRYFLIGGSTTEQSSTLTLPLSGGDQGGQPGLYRQSVDRVTAHWANQIGESDVSQAGIQLLAPEVVRLEFEYFDGAQVYQEWSMLQRDSPPRSIRVHLWLTQVGAAPTTRNTTTAQQTLNDATNGAFKFSRVIHLPLAEVSQLESESTGDSSSASQQTGTSEEAPR